MEPVLLVLAGMGRAAYTRRSLHKWWAKPVFSFSPATAYLLPTPVELCWASPGAKGQQSSIGEGKWKSGELGG